MRYAVLILFLLSGCASIGERSGPPTGTCGKSCQEWLAR